MFFFGRGVSAFFNQFFKWLFWNKTGQKFLFSILIVVIFFVFIKCGEVSAVEEVSDVNYEVKSYYDGVLNDAIIRIYRIWGSLDDGTKGVFLNTSNIFYFYYGNNNGSSYENARPTNSNPLHYAIISRANAMSDTSISNYDYLGVTGYTMYSKTGVYGYDVNTAGSLTYFSNRTIVFPLFVLTYTNENWSNFLNALRNNDTEEIKAILSEINDNLSNTDPTSETDSFVDIDSSSVDDLSSASVDNVFSNMTTSFSNKFTNYDLDTVYSFVWNLNGTRITFYSDTLYKMIQGTFFETLLSMLWYYIFGHYAFVWLSNIIHKIKDGSILDGLEVNEVITKEML